MLHGSHMRCIGTWNSMGARGRAAGLSARVADFRMAVPRPPMASTLPAGTTCRPAVGISQLASATQTSALLPMSHPRHRRSTVLRRQRLLDQTSPMSQSAARTDVGACCMAQRDRRKSHLQALQAAAHHEVQPRDRGLLPLPVWLRWGVRRRQHLHQKISTPLRKGPMSRCNPRAGCRCGALQCLSNSLTSDSAAAAPTARFCVCQAAQHVTCTRITCLHCGAFAGHAGEHAPKGEEYLCMRVWRRGLPMPPARQQPFWHPLTRSEH